MNSVSARILLVGPANSELCQEALTCALARELGAKTLVVDRSALLDMHEPEARDDPGPSAGLRSLSNYG